MDLASPTTALSPAVKRLICYLGCWESHKQTKNEPLSAYVQSPARCESETRDTEYQPLLTFNEQLDSDCVASLLPASDDSAEYFEKAVVAVSPVLMQCQSVLVSMSDDSIHSTLLPQLQWTRSEKIFHDCLEMLREEKDDNCKTVLVLLLVSAVLERALGNVFLLQGTQCPSMLKDLLATPELANILGRSVIQILRLLIGPPISLNLRNVAWHGFLGDKELPHRYCCFLIFLTASMGGILERGRISGITPRPYVVWASELKTKILSALQVSDCVIEDRGVHGVREVLTQSGIIQPHTQQQWQLVFHLYQHSRYGYCFALLLPLMEHCLRRVFATVNNCPERVLTAESSAFYTTFNEILDQTMSDGVVNQLPKFLTTPCMDLLQDLLFYPEGPRVRDHLSHGEVDFTAVDQQDVFPFICVSVFVAHRLGAHPSSSSEACADMIAKVKNYKSVFHPVAILQQKFDELLKRLENTEGYVILSSDLELLQENSSPVQLCEDNALLARTQQGISSLWQCESWTKACPLSRDDLSNGFSMKLDLLKQISQDHIPTLFRWQSEGDTARAGTMRESEYVGLLQRITEECIIAIEQLQCSLEQRQRQLCAKQLRSRQRETLKKLLMCVPCLQMLVTVILICLSWNIQSLNHYTTFTPTRCRMLQKFLKLTLQHCENLRTLTSSDKNKWTESVDLLLSWIPKCQQLFVQWQQLSV